MNEKLIIENFGGLEYAEFELRDINILIGPQASGKSVSVKLMYFFKNFISEILRSIENNENKRQLDSNQIAKFNLYFPKVSWSKGDFSVKYTLNKDYIVVYKIKNKSVKFDYSEGFKKIWNNGRKIAKEERKTSTSEVFNPNRNRNIRRRFNKMIADCLVENISTNHFFIPAGRSFFANVQSSIFSFLSQNKSLDPFLIEFGVYYENFKLFGNPKSSSKSNIVFDKLISQIINGDYLIEKKKEFIIHKDTRKVNLAQASSGQQEIMPLVMMLKRLKNIVTKNRMTIYIEEPEAHLFPNAQKNIVQLLTRTFNSKSTPFQIIVTTHSPYILSAFNNLLEAGKIIKEQPKREKDVQKVIPKEEIIFPKNLIAYSVNKGKIKSLMDKETKLISNNILDAVSDEIAIDFGKLLDIEF